MPAKPKRDGTSAARGTTRRARIRQGARTAAKKPDAGKGGRRGSSDFARQAAASSSRFLRAFAPPRPPPASPAADGVRFTHTDRVVFPDKGYTKGDVLAYYQTVAPKLLPHLRDRPVTLERLPAGVTGEKAPHFWQKNTPPYYPAFIPRVKLPTETGKPVDYALVNDERALLYLVNQNVLTFHTWFSTASDPDTPTYVLFDIDPHQSTFANAVAVATKLHEILDHVGVASFLKTSGKSGLHVMTPWKAADGGFEEARAWAERLAQEVARALPKIATTERMIDRRGRRVYVDAMQNARGKHVVPPYVLRASPAAGVSTPLEWRELTAKLTPAQFDLKSAVKRFAKQKADPLAVLTGGARPGK